MKVRMTATPIQNIEQKQTDLTNIITTAINTKGDTDKSFSNLINNASSKVEKTQTDFIDRAVKSNTSSINQYAIKNKQNIQSVKQDNKLQAKAAKKQENNQFVQDTQIKQSTKNKIAEPKNSKDNNQIALKSTNNTVSQKEQTFKTTKTNDVQTPVNTNQTKVQTKDVSQKTADTTKDSLEPSPVLSEKTSGEVELKAQISNTETDYKDVETEVKDIVQNILVTFDVPIQQDNTQGIDLENAFNAGENNNYDYIIKAIDDISSQIDNMDLSQEDKDRIFAALNTLKTTVQDINETDFETDDLISDAKKLLDGIVLKSVNDKKPEITQEIKTDETKGVSKEEVSSVQNQTSLISSDVKEKVENVIENVKQILDEIKADSQIDGNTVKAISENVEKIVSNLKDLAQNIKNIKDEKPVDIDKKLVETLKALSEKDGIDLVKDIQKISSLVEDIKDSISDLKEEKPALETNEEVNLEQFKTEDKEVSKDNIKEIEIKNDKISLKEEKPVSDNTLEVKKEINLEQFKIEDNDTLAEIKEKLQEFSETKEYKELSTDDKKEIENLINKISEIEENRKDTETTKIAEVKEEINQIIDAKIQKTSDEDTQVQNNQDISQKPKTIASDAKNAQNDTSFKGERQSSNNEKISLKDNAKIQENENLKDSELNENKADEVDEAEGEIEIDTKTKTKLSDLHITEIQDDILEDIEYTEESPAALTVQDELVKIALNENSSLNNQQSAGNVVYGLGDKAVTIKNIQNIVQQPQYKEVNQSNILNQIGDKLYQLKDSQKLMLVLRPDDLGRLSIELTSDKNGLTTNIIAQNEHVRNYIERNINSLRSQLSEAGVNVNTIQVKTAGQDNSATYEGNQNKEFQQEQQQQKQQNQQKQQQQAQKDDFANMQNYDFHFAKDFSSVLNKTLSYID